MVASRLLGGLWGEGYSALGAQAAPGVDQLAVGGGGDPGGGIVRNTVFAPVTQRRREGFLHRLFGTVEGTAQPNQAGNDPSVLAAKRAGFETIMVPTGNADEASLVPGVRVIPVASLRDAAL